MGIKRQILLSCFDEIWIAYFLDLSKDTAVVFLISNFL